MTGLTNESETARMTPEDKKTLLRSMISYIEINKERKPHGQLLRKIHFTFPVTYDGESGVLFVSSNDRTVETVVLMSRADAAGRYPNGERCQ